MEPIDSLVRKPEYIARLLLSGASHISRPMQSSFVNNMSGGELLYITLGDKILFENPYVGKKVRSIGVTTMIVSTKEYLETGTFDHREASIRH